MMRAMRSRISWLWCSLSGRCCCKEILSLRASNRDVIPRASKHNGVWASNQGRPMDSSGLHRLTWKDRSKPRASAAFCRYGLVSVCGNWRRKRLFGFLSALVGFRQCPELTREATTTPCFSRILKAGTAARQHHSIILTLSAAARPASLACKPTTARVAPSCVRTGSPLLDAKWGRRARNLIVEHGATLGVRLSDDSHAAGRCRCRRRCASRRPSRGFSRTRQDARPARAGPARRDAGGAPILSFCACPHTENRFPLFRDMRRPGSRALDPGQDELVQRVAVVLQHHHVAVADHPVIAQEPEIRFRAILVQPVGDAQVELARMADIVGTG